MRAEIAWVRETFAALEPHLTGGAYANFMEGDEPDAAAVAYGATLARLRRVKRGLRPRERVPPQPEHRAVSALDEQRELWSAAPRDWAEIAEPQNEALFARLLDACGVGEGTRLLDVACGSGFAAAMAAARGATVAGVDVTPPLLAIARERTPAGDFREAGMDELPFAGRRRSTWSPASTASSSRSTRRSRCARRRACSCPAGVLRRRRSPSPSATRARRCTWP